MIHKATMDLPPTCCLVVCLVGTDLVTASAGFNSVGMYDHWLGCDTFLFVATRNIHIHVVPTCSIVNVTKRNFAIA